MATLNPVISPSIQHEQPVVSQSGIGAAADIGASIFSSFSAPAAPSASDREHNTLLPLSTSLKELRDSLDDGHITGAQFAVESRGLVKSFAANNPEFESEGVALLDTISGIGAAPLLTPTADLAQIAKQEWSATPQGQMAIASSLVANSDGSLNEAATAANFSVAYADSLAQTARIARTAQSILEAKGDNELIAEIGKGTVRDTTPLQTTNTTNVVNGLLIMANSGDASLDQPEEVLLALEEQKRLLTAQYRAEYQSTNTDAALYNPALVEALAPLNDLIASIGANGEHLAAVAKANSNMATIGLQAQMTEVFGIIGAAPEFSEAMIREIANSSGTKAAIASIVADATNRADLGFIDTMNSIIPVVGGGDSSTFEPASVVRPEAIEFYSSLEGEERTRRVGDAISVGSTTLRNLSPASSDVDNQRAINDFGNALAAASALSEPLSKEYLTDLLVTPNKNIVYLVNSGSQLGVELSSAVTSLAVTELNKNNARVRNIVSQMPDGFSVGTTNGSTSVVFDRRAFILSESPDNVRVRSALTAAGMEISEANVMKALRDNIQVRPAITGSMMGGMPSAAEVTRQQEIAANKGTNTQFGQAGNLDALTQHVENINIINSALARMPEVKEAVTTTTTPPKLGAGSTSQTVTMASPEITNSLGTSGTMESVQGVVVHHTGGKNKSVEDITRVLNENGASVHYWINRDGGVHQLMPDNAIAWHAGANNDSGFDNNNTIGIEIEGMDDEDINQKQIDAAQTLINNLSETHGFDPLTNVFGHGEVATHKHPTEGQSVVDAVRGKSIRTASLNSPEDLAADTSTALSNPNLSSPAGNREMPSAGQTSAATQPSLSLELSSSITDAGGDPTTTKQYATEEEAQAALDRGEVKLGEIVIIAGKAVRIEDDDNESAPTEALSFNTPFEGSKLPVSDYPDVPEGISGILKDNRANPSTTLVFGSKEEFEKASSNLPEDTTHVLIAGILYPVGVAQ